MACNFQVAPVATEIPATEAPAQPTEPPAPTNPPATLTEVPPTPAPMPFELSSTAFKQGEPIPIKYPVKAKIFRRP